MKKTLADVPHYFWGDGCEGWRMVESDSLSIIREKMPPGTSEQLHYHQQAQQFFYMLSGEARFEIAGESTVVKAGEGIRIMPGLKHRILNESGVAIEFIVTSAPATRGDRINCETL
ncbi:cupin [Chitinophaga caeni]|uniref:Cupin n=1 Tax=Chitinophaga caeni TaxID=2029983 RepID=A0A291QTI4_9BACT|nr:cupin domain-containing protein [Chitinophaga caeni]ATL47256.1 cupin [Chitinophaga caeni]